MKKTKYIFALQPFLITFGTFIYNWKVNQVVASVDWPTIAALAFALIKIINITLTNTQAMLDKLKKKEILFTAKKMEAKLVKAILAARLKASKEAREFSWLNAKAMINKAAQDPTWYHLIKSTHTTYNNVQQLTAVLQYRLAFGGKK